MAILIRVSLFLILWGVTINAQQLFEQNQSKNSTVSACDGIPFCNRYQNLEHEFIDQYKNSKETDFYYAIDPSTILVNDENATITAQLYLACNDISDYISQTLNLTL